jgi:hypothetical protein
MTQAPEVRQLLAIIDQAYDHQSWHGTNLRGSIRRVTPEQAAWRPGPTRHNIWEVVVHAAYWKYAVARRFTGDARGSFPLKGSNWFRRPEERSGAGQRGPALRQKLRASRATSRDASEATIVSVVQGSPRVRDEMSDRAWRSDIALLDRLHVSLREAVAKLPASHLYRTPPGKKVSNFALLSGIAAHDLYHAGQIQLLKTLSKG